MDEATITKFVTDALMTPRAVLQTRASVAAPGGAVWRGARIVDLDGDGALDVLAWSEQSLDVFRGTTSAQNPNNIVYPIFSRVSFPIDGNILLVATGDIDADGNTDIALAARGDSSGLSTDALYVLFGRKGAPEEPRFLGRLNDVSQLTLGQVSWLLQGTPDRFQSIAHGRAVPVSDAESSIQGHCSGVHARAEHGWRESRPFLVGPIDHRERPLQQAPCLLQCPQDLQPGKNAENAVEASAERLGVEMAAHGDRHQGGIAARIEGEHVAYSVDAQLAFQLAAPGREPVAHLAILLRERQPRDPAAGRAAEAGGRDDVVPQPVTGDGGDGAFRLAGRQCSDPSGQAFSPPAGSFNR